MSKRVFVSGATGYLGARVIDFLKEDFAPVGVTRDVEKFKTMFPGIPYRYFDLNSSTDIDDNEPVDAFIHLGGYGYNEECDRDPVYSTKINVEGASSLFSCLARRGLKNIIYPSTIHVYGYPLEGTISEETSTNPVSQYAKQRLATEEIVLNQDNFPNLTRTVLRLSNAVGHPLTLDSHGWKLIGNHLCFEAFHKNKLETKSDGLQRRNFIAIDDFLKTLKLFLNNPTPGIFNLGSSRNFSIAELVFKIQTVYESITHRKIECVLGKISEKIPKNPLVFDISKLTKIGIALDSDIDRTIENTFEFLFQKIKSEWNKETL